MKLDALPPPMLAKLLVLEQEAAQLAEQTLRCENAIKSGQARLRGGAHGLKQKEHDDLIVAVREAVAKLPKLQARASTAQAVVLACKRWIESLPEHTQLRQKQINVDGHDLAGVRNRMASIKAELAMLRAVPTVAPDIEQRVKAYVSGLAKPKVSGIQEGEALKVSWPNDPAILAAIFAPDAMTDAIMGEINRVANTPMPAPERAQKISALEHEFRELLYLEEELLAEGDERSASALPWAILSAAIVVAGKNGNGKVADTQTEAKTETKTEAKTLRRSVRRKRVTAAERAQAHRDRFQPWP